jgi:hypothetical protein
MNHQTERFFEELSALLLLAGGRRFSTDELADMKIGQILEMGTPNGVSIKAYPTNSHPTFGGIRNDWI